MLPFEYLQIFTSKIENVIYIVQPRKLNAYWDACNPYIPNIFEYYALVTKLQSLCISSTKFLNSECQPSTHPFSKWEGKAFAI